MEFKNLIRTIPDFPIPGIRFRDITTVLKDPAGLKASINQMADMIGDVDFDLVIGPESRGFIFGVPLAFKMGKGFVPVRKENKLPIGLTDDGYNVETKKIAYELEYGKTIIEIHKDAIKPGDKIVIADDLLATGGTCKAVCQMVEELGGQVVGILFFIELKELDGRENLKGYNVKSLVTY